MNAYDFKLLRTEMVAQLRRRGVEDTAVLQAMNTVPREDFVLAQLRAYAYEDGPLPIPAGQTISQPYIVALMIEALALKPNDRVLEVGTGSGYAAAVLSCIANSVYSVERQPELVTYARQRLTRGGYDNVQVRYSNGTLGWPEEAPFDAILVSAGGPAIPPSLREQLAEGGHLVMPVGSHIRHQQLIRLTRLPDNCFHEEWLAAVAFVPLVGKEGWPAQEGVKQPFWRTLVFRYE